MARSRRQTTPEPGSGELVVGRYNVNRVPPPTMYDLLPVYVQEPCVKPDGSLLAYARPFEFADDLATKYTVTSPHCGCGIIFEPHEIQTRFGMRFLRCPCVPPPPEASERFEDPFVNPVTAGILTFGDNRSLEIETMEVTPNALQSLRLPEEVDPTALHSGAAENVLQAMLDELLDVDD